jgi:hypothetical protein
VLLGIRTNQKPLTLSSMCLVRTTPSASLTGLEARVLPRNGGPRVLDRGRCGEVRSLVHDYLLPSFDAPSPINGMPNRYPSSPAHLELHYLWDTYDENPVATIMAKQRSKRGDENRENLLFCILACELTYIFRPGSWII